MSRGWNGNLSPKISMWSVSWEFRTVGGCKSFSKIEPLRLGANTVHCLQTQKHFHTHMYKHTQTVVQKEIDTQRYTDRQT